MNGNRPEPHLVSAAFSAMLDEHAPFVLVLPGLWGLGVVHREVEALANGLRIVGGSGRLGTGDEEDGGLASATPAVDLRSAFVSAGTPPDPNGGYSRAWGSLGVGGHLITVKTPEALDPGTLDILVRAIRDGSHRVIVVLEDDRRVPGPFSVLERTGLLPRRRLAPMGPCAFATMFETLAVSPPDPVTLEQLRIVTGAHRALLDLVVEAACDAGVLARRAGAWTWAWDPSRIRQALAPSFAALLARWPQGQHRVISTVALAGALPETQLSRLFGYDRVLALQDCGVLVHRRADRTEGELLQLGPELLRWAVMDTVTEAEMAVAWYETEEELSEMLGRSGPGSEPIGLAVWRTQVEGTLPAADARVLARRAVDADQLENARHLLAAAVDAAPSSHGDVSLQVVAARHRWSSGEPVEALELLEGCADSLWSHAPTAVRCDAALLLMHIAVFHRERAFAVLTAHDTSGTPDEETGGTSTTCVLERIRSVGVSLLADVIEAVEIDGDPDQGLALVRGRVLDVGTEEAALAQLWLGSLLGIASGQDLGRQVLSELLDELDRERTLPTIVDSAHALLLVISLYVGWSVDDMHVGTRTGTTDREFRRGLASVHTLVRSTLALQDDRMHTAHQHARVGEELTRGGDPYAMRPVALALAAATSGYLPGTPEAADGARLRTELAACDDAASPHLRYFAHGLGLVGSGPPTHEVSAALVRCADTARAEGAHAQAQQLLLLAVLGGDRIAVQCVLDPTWPRTNGRVGMIELVASALAQAMQAAEVDDPAAAGSGDLLDAGLDLVEAFMDGKARYLGHTLLRAWWTVCAAGAGPPQRLVRLVLRARAEAPEYSWLLGTFAPELVLDERDLAIVRGLHHGASTGMIAERLHLSPRTVEGLVSRLLGRLYCSTRLDLVRLLDGLVGDDP